MFLNEFQGVRSFTLYGKVNNQPMKARGGEFR